MITKLVGPKCWLCGRPIEGYYWEIKTNCETPNGKKCKTKAVKVHPGCYLDMEP